jgi:hypothetical protein
MQREYPHIVVYGIAIDGFFFVGPFPTAEEAVQYADSERESQDWWIAPLDSPASWGEHKEVV